MRRIVDHIATTYVYFTGDQCDETENLCSRVARTSFCNIGFGDTVLMELLRLILKKTFQRLRSGVSCLESTSRIGKFKGANEIVFTEDHWILARSQRLLPAFVCWAAAIRASIAWPRASDA